jgi:hypothetical protein
MQGVHRRDGSIRWSYHRIRRVGQCCRCKLSQHPRVSNMQRTECQSGHTPSVQTEVCEPMLHEE